MITNVSLRNFRGFEDEISLRLKPITVLIGRNSAGKSSLVKFLLMLRQTLESQRDEFFVSNGRYVQLGDWSELKNTVNKGPSLEFCIRVETTDVPNEQIRQVWTYLSKHGVVDESGKRVRIAVDIDNYPVNIEQPSASYSVEGRIPYSSRVKKALHSVVGKIDGKVFFSKKATNLVSMGFLRFSRSTDSLNDLFENVLAEQFLDRLRYEFTSIRHLSPVREESVRTIQSGNPPFGDVGDRGEYAISHLVQLMMDSKRINDIKFFEHYAMKVADVDKISLESRFRSLAIQVKAHNPITGALSYLADFGFGVSQCLPIFIQGLLQEPGQLLIVEQPEAQLHPTAQLELGSFFVDLWNKRKVPSLIETHSANVLLRIRKLVRQGVLNPSDVSVGYFTVKNNKIVVINMDIEEDGSLEDGLPMEFFGADVIEVIGM